MSGLPFTDINLEDLNKLVGKLPKSAQEKAVTVGDVSELARITKKSKVAAGSPPTKAEFDALVYDVHRLIDVLNAIGGSS